MQNDCINHIIGYWQNIKREDNWAVILCLQGINQIRLVDFFDRSEQY